MNIKKKNDAGFNLLELMIVISVIALLISVSGYAWQIMVRRGNEAAAISHVTKINTAQAYYASKNNGRFATTFRDLVRSNLIDKSFSADNPVVNGYRFTLTTGKAPSSFFSVNADPVVASGVAATGTTHYYLDSGLHKMTRTDDQRPANKDDPSL